MSSLRFQIACKRDEIFGGKISSSIFSASRYGEKTLLKKVVKENKLELLL